RATDVALVAVKAWPVAVTPLLSEAAAMRAAAVCGAGAVVLDAAPSGAVVPPKSLLAVSGKAGAPVAGAGAPTEGVTAGVATDGATTLECATAGSVGFPVRISWMMAQAA